MADPDTTDRNETEPSDISSALDVEQLDLNLYRSRNLSLNFDARGVFGGQVISQALVAATNCVKSEFTLHVRVPPPPYTHADQLTYYYYACVHASNSLYMYVQYIRNTTYSPVLQMTLTRESESVISSLVHPLPPHCSTTSIEYATGDHTRRVPSAPSKADATSSSCSVPSRYRSSGSHRVTGRCRKLPVRTNVTPRSNTSDAWQRIETLRNKAERDSSHMQKCVILFYLSRFYNEIMGR